MTPLARLAGQPGRFTLDQAAAVAAAGGDVLDLRWRTAARLGYPAGEVLSARAAEANEPATLVTANFGLVGTGGVLPRHHTALVAAETRKRSGALHAFLDPLAGRFVGLFVRAGAKYRPTRDAVPAERALAAAVGIATPHLGSRAGASAPTLLYHAGHLAARGRSADRLAAMLAEELGTPVRIEEFAGGWVRLPPEERSRLPRASKGEPEGRHAALGAGAVLGAETWDAQARIDVRIGPLQGPAFAALLPGTPRHARVVALTRLFLGLDTGFVLRPVLAAASIPPLALGGTSAGRLGWTSWLPRPAHGSATGSNRDSRAVDARLRCAAGHGHDRQPRCARHWSSQEEHDEPLRAHAGRPVLPRHPSRTRDGPAHHGRSGRGAPADRSAATHHARHPPAFGGTAIRRTPSLPGTARDRRQPGAAGAADADGGDAWRRQVGQRHRIHHRAVPHRLGRAHAGREVQMAQQLTGARAAAVRLGADFTPASLRSGELAQHRIIHLATHALLPGELSCLPEPSIVVSTPAGAADAAASFIKASDLLALKLDPDLIVLSACNTGSRAAPPRRRRCAVLSC